MDDAGAMRRVERRAISIAYRSACSTAAALRQRSASVSPSRYSMTRNAVPSCVADVVQGADVRMIELRDPRALRARSARGTADRGDASGRTLIATVAVEPRVARLVDLAHAAGADAARRSRTGRGDGPACRRTKRLMRSAASRERSSVAS